MANTDTGRLRYIRDQAGQVMAAIIAGRAKDSLAMSQHDRASLPKLVQSAFIAAEQLTVEFETRHPEILNDNDWTGVP